MYTASVCVTMHVCKCAASILGADDAVSEFLDCESDSEDVGGVDTSC